MSPRPAPPYDRFDLTGRVALITGGTRGLGRAIIQTLAQAGADVVVSSRKQEACDEAAEEARSFGRRALARACHVGRWEEIDELVEAAYAEFGRIDVLVNNAGIAPTYPDAQSVTEELWDKVIAVNLKGPFRLTALVGSRMAAGDGGSIVNITSIGAVRPTHDILVYAAAKAGLNALTLGFADTFGPKVRVNAVMPGPFLTDISREWNHEAFAERARTFPLRRAGVPEELASAVLYFASDASSFTTGSILAVDGGAQWSLAGGGDQAAQYGKSVYDGTTKKDWTLTATRFSLPTLNWIRFPGGDEDVPDGELIPAWPLDDLLAAAAAAGFRDVGLDDLTVAAADPEEVAALLRSHGLVCTDVGVLRVGASEIRQQAEGLAALAAATGAEVCIAAVYTPTAADALAGLRAAATVLADAGVRIALEFAPYGGLPTLSDAIDVCSAVGWDRCGLLVDTWHFFRSDEPWPLLRSLDADQIALVHVNDAPAPERDLVYESRFRRLPVGSGTFAITEFAGTLAAAGYDGVLSTEVLSSALRRRSPTDGARELLESLHRFWPVNPPRTVEMN